MMKQMLNTFKKALNLFRDFITYFYKGWQAGLVRPYTKYFIVSMIIHLNRFRHSLFSGGIGLHNIRDEKIRKLQTTSHDLHALLPFDPRFSYSILMVVSQPNASYFRISLESALNQSATNLEILIGLLHPPTQLVKEVLFDLQNLYPLKLRVFDFSEAGEKDLARNQLAEYAKGNFLFFMGEEDWMRPDLLFRYEQILRVFSEPLNQVLYCNFNQLSHRHSFLPLSEQQQPSKFCFPYIFKQFFGNALLVPAVLWNKVKGLNHFLKELKMTICYCALI